MAAGKRDDAGLSCLSGEIRFKHAAVHMEGLEFNIFGEEALFSLPVQPRHFDLVSKPPEDVQLLDYPRLTANSGPTNKRAVHCGSPRTHLSLYKSLHNPFSGTPDSTAMI